MDSSINTQAARELLAALLVNSEDEDAIAYDDSRYIDWSCRTQDQNGQETGRIFELGDDDGATSIELSWAEIERLQRALTLALINRNV
jgi:hypothetical protein